MFWSSITIILPSYSFRSESWKDIDEIFYCPFLPFSHSIVDHPSKSIKRSCISIADALLLPSLLVTGLSMILAKKNILDDTEEREIAFLNFFHRRANSIYIVFLCASIPDWKACNYTQIYVSLVEIIKFSSVSIEWSNDSKKNDLSTLSTSSFTWSVDFSLVLIMFSTIILLNNNYK